MVSYDVQKVDDEDNTYRVFKIEVDINLNDEFTDAEIAIKLTNESNQVTQLPKEFQPCLFFMRLEVKTFHISLASRKETS